MSPAQRTMLFSMFNRACQAANLTGSIARDQYREQLTIKVCGKVISWNDFNNQQIDGMKAEILAILRPADLDAQLAQIAMPRTRLLYSIDKQFGVNYATKVALDKFGVTDITRLSDEQLDQLHITLINRKRSKARKTKQREPVEEPF